MTKSKSMIIRKNLTSMKCFQCLVMKTKVPRRKSLSSSVAGLKLLVRKSLTLTSKSMHLRSTRLQRNYLWKTLNNRSKKFQRSMTQNQLAEKINTLTSLLNQLLKLKIPWSSKPSNLDKFTKLRSDELWWVWASEKSSKVTQGLAFSIPNNTRQSEPENIESSSERVDIFLTPEMKMWPH